MRLWFRRNGHRDAASCHAGPQADTHGMYSLMPITEEERVAPGNPIKLLRRSPAYIFQVGYSQFAVDRDIAEEIYVR